MKKCKVCGDKTEVVFNIDFKATPICEGCATAIFLQQAKWYTEKQGQKLPTDKDVNERNKQLCQFEQDERYESSTCKHCGGNKWMHE